jgi:hypothetical protein
MKRAFPILALVLIPTVLIGCVRQDRASARSAVSGPANPDDTAPVSLKGPAIDACSLLRAAEVEPLFGRLKGAPRSDRGLQYERQCRYTSVAGQWLETSLYGTERWELVKGIVREQHPRAIANLGDEAFSVTPGTDSVIYIRKGPAVLQVSSSGGMDTTKALAAKAIEKL